MPTEYGRLVEWDFLIRPHVAPRQDWAIALSRRRGGLMLDGNLCLTRSGRTTVAPLP